MAAVFRSDFWHVLEIARPGYTRKLNYADLFSVTLRDDNVQEFDTRWDEVLRSMPKIFGKFAQIENT